MLLPIVKVVNHLWKLKEKQIDDIVRNGDSRVTRANLLRRVTFFSKMAFGECLGVWRVRATQLGECRRVWLVRATRLGECRQVWQVTTSTRNVPKTRPRVLARVLATFAKLALNKFAVELPLLSLNTYVEPKLKIGLLI